MPRELLHVVDDILEAIAGVERSIAGKTFEDYKSDWLLKHALQRAIEIISETSRASRRSHLDAAAYSLARHTRDWQCPAARITFLSDKIIWEVICDELPPLKAAVEAIGRDAGRP